LARVGTWGVSPEILRAAASPGERSKIGSAAGDGAGAVGGGVAFGAVDFGVVGFGLVATAGVGAGVGVVAGGVESAVGVGVGVVAAGLGEGSVDAVGDVLLAGSLREWTMMRTRTSPTTSGTTMARMLM